MKFGDIIRKKKNAPFRSIKKGKKKTLEHSPTLTTAHEETGNQMISDTP